MNEVIFVQMLISIYVISFGILEIVFSQVFLLTSLVIYVPIFLGISLNVAFLDKGIVICSV